MIRPRSLLLHLAGPAGCAAFAGLLVLLDGTGLRLQNPVLLFALLIVLSAYGSGIAAGLASVAVTFAFTAVYWSLPGRPFHYAPADVQRLAIQAVTMPAMAVLVGALRRRGEARARALAEALERERDLSASLTGVLNQVRQLEGLLPICAYCHKVRDDAGYWERIEAFISSRTNASFTHGICPACFEKLEATLPPGGEKPPR